MATTQLPDETPVDITDMADILETIRLAKAEIEKWEAVRDAAIERVKGRLGHHEDGQIHGRTAVTWKWRNVRRLDVTEIRSSIPAEVLAPFEKISVERRFEVKS